ncbi:MAG: site-2 protease family protein [Verrucomicrobiota bacterium]|nr:site-2 protease family protein [Verrucomicrobiota bacterium]
MIKSEEEEKDRADDGLSWANELNRNLSWKEKIKKYLAPIGIVLLLLIKFGAKLKFLILPILKFFPVLLKTGGTMLFSIWAYSLFWGWKFAAGLVILILLHEFGHLIAARLFRLKVGLPVFIPFMGALIALKEAPRHAWVEFWIAAGGPIFGGLASLGCHCIYFATGNEFFSALAYTGYFLNLFNLMPTGFLDGGRMVTALSPWLWLVGILIAGAFAVYRPSFIIFLILLCSLPRLFSLFRKKTKEEQRYYEVTPFQRGVAAFVYFGLIFALGVGMLSAFVERTAS